MGSLVKQCFTYDTFLLLLPLLQIRCQLPPSARTLHCFDESTHNSVQRLQPLRHVGREEPENDSVLVHQLLELVCFVHRCIVTHQQKTLSRKFIRSCPRRQRARQGYLLLSTLKTANTVRLSSRLQLVLTILALFFLFWIMVSNFSINGSGS